MIGIIFTNFSSSNFYEISCFGCKKVFPPLLYKQDQQRIFIREKNKEFLEICEQIILPYLKVNHRLEKLVILKDIAGLENEKIESNHQNGLPVLSRNSTSKNNNNFSSYSSNNSSFNNLSDVFSSNNNLSVDHSHSHPHSLVVGDSSFVNSLSSLFSCLKRKLSKNSDQLFDVPLYLFSFHSPHLVDSHLVEHLFLDTPPQKEVSTLIPLYRFFF